MEGTYLRDIQSGECRDFLGGPAVKTLSVHCGGRDPINCWGTEVLRATPKKSGIQNAHALHEFSFFPTQGALEIPVSAEPSTGVQPPKGWS